MLYPTNGLQHRLWVAMSLTFNDSALIYTHKPNGPMHWRHKTWPAMLPLQYFFHELLSAGDVV